MLGGQGHWESAHWMLAHRSSHDMLTAMPNRAAFDEQLAARIEGAATRRSRFALLFIDVDNFKAANDGFGHAAGDAVLVALAARIRAVLRRADFAARIGGDEFAVIAEPVDARADAEELALRICNAVAEPVALTDRSEEHTSELPSLLRNSY